MAIAKLRVTVAPSPPPSPHKLHNHHFSFLLSITVILREITNNAYAKSWGANKVYDYLYRRRTKAIILIATVVKLLYKVKPVNLTDL